MKRTRLAASDLFSIPESASSMDVFMRSYPTSVEASVSDWDGDPYLRIAASKKNDDGEVLSAEEIQKRIKQWKDHTQQNAANAGFRKANRGRGPMDPRRFALQLSEVARLNAQRYGSPSLARLAKKLRWVAAQDTGVATQALNKMAGPYNSEDPRNQRVPGMPELRRPLDQPPAPPVRPGQTLPPSRDLDRDPGFVPGTPTENNRDLSWSSQESGRLGKKTIVHNTDQALVTLARDFIQDYQSNNPLSDDDLIEKLHDGEVFEAWQLTLDGSGRRSDFEELNAAWQEAIDELTQGLEGEEELPVQTVQGSKDYTTIQDQTAPGGDWFNTVINMNENPVMDRYLKKMANKRTGFSRRAKEEKEDSRVIHAVDQLLDHYAGEMLLGEISEDHVKKFVGENYPDVDAKKVYADIQKIADPKKRHEEDPKRTNEAVRRKKTASVSRSPLVRLASSPFDDFLAETRAGFQKLLGQQEICSGCRGLGEGRQGCCGHCGGSGRDPIDPDGEDGEKKAATVARLGSGSLLLVSVDAGNRRVSDRDRRVLASVTKSRVAGSGKPLVFRHSTTLMEALIARGIPYRTAGYTHPGYRR